jgi:hypothetical protein
MNLLNLLLRKLYKNWEIQDNLSIQTQTYLLIMSNTSLQKMGGVIALLASSLALSNPASALPGFSGDYAPGNWTFLNSNANGNVNTAAAPTSITLTGGDNGSSESGTTDYTIVAVAGGNLSFDWNYTTEDGAGTDPFEFLLNGIDTTLTDPGGDQTQSGSFISILLTGDTFGFRILTTDNILGPGIVTISNFDISNATPIPFEFNPVAGVAILGGLWAGKRFLKSRKTK